MLTISKMSNSFSRSNGKLKNFRLEAFFNPNIFEPLDRSHREDKITSYKVPPEVAQEFF